LLADWAAQLGEKWDCQFGQVGYDRICPLGMLCLPNRGLQLLVWQKKDCSQVVIAFRGSDARDLEDMVSNLRWFVVNPYFDEYKQVRAIVGRVIARVHCRHARIIATGHSLGGGLAQHAAYAAGGRIGYVYAFDPSPVTGYFDVPWEERMHTVERFGIDRIYQAGEVLSLPRYFVSGIFPTPTCRPRVRIVRFATIQSSSLFERHKIEQLTAGLVKLEKEARSSQVPDDYAKALTCTFSPPPDRPY